MYCTFSSVYKWRQNSPQLCCDATQDGEIDETGPVLTNLVAPSVQITATMDEKEHLLKISLIRTKHSALGYLYYHSITLSVYFGFSFHFSAAESYKKQRRILVYFKILIYNIYLLQLYLRVWQEICGLPWYATELLHSVSTANESVNSFWKPVGLENYPRRQRLSTISNSVLYWRRSILNSSQFLPWSILVLNK